MSPGATTVLVRSGSLTGEVIVEVLPPLPVPLAHFPLDGTAADVSGGGRNGTIFGGLVATNGARGAPGTALEFNGTDGFIEFPNLDLPGAFTLAAWVRPEVTPDGSIWGAIVGKFTSPGNWELNINDVTSRIVVHTSTTTGVFSPSPVAADRWVHIVATYDGTGTLKIYTDGALVAQGGGYAPPPSTSVLPRIGRSSWGGNPFKGAIDDVRIYGVELSAGEVARLFAVAGS